MRVLVVHPAQQHSYYLASALAKKGWLEKYITTVYWKKWSFTYIVSLFLRGNFRKKAKARICEDLKDSDVLQFCEIEGLLKLLSMNVPAFRPFYKKIKYHTADRFAKKVAHFAIKHQVDAVVSFDDCSSLLFELLKKQAPQILRIMDVSAANILFMREIYERDVKLQPDFADILYKEREIVWNEDNIKRAEKEWKYGQIFLVPSHFVKKSLEFSRIREEQIRICPYGVDTVQFGAKKYYRFTEKYQRPIHFVYVGGVKELKGISYLLQTIERFSASEADLTVVGNVNLNAPEIQPYLKRAKFTGSVLHWEISEILMKADVFVFPSLGEGLSLAALEAASCGLPLIVSANSGINDAITDGQEGFVIPIQSVDILVEKMKWFIEYPQEIERMGRAARKMTFNYTWKAYEQRIGRIFEELEVRRTGKWEK